MHTKNKVLFLLKRREDYNSDKHSHIGLSTGLFNSASFMNEMLNKFGVDSHLEVVIDNNDIDREVTKHKPTHVIIEALWVVPTKFTVLTQLHPKVIWIVRLHSEMPFLAGEGMSLDWLGDYANFPKILIGANAPRALDEVRFYLKHKMNCSDEYINKKVIYLPNFYPQNYKTKKFDRDKDVIHISCFGAIRPLKNHMLQAMAAVKFAEKLGKKLRFHINSGRVEMNGNPVLNNLKSFFSHLQHKGHQLINHEWTPRDEFLKICAKMDIGMQASISETFNIVGADLISQGVPLVGSKEIPWANPVFCGNPLNTDDIYKALILTYYFPQFNVKTNQFLLTRYTSKTRKIWLNYFKK
jgi:hypothetical protein